MGLSARWATGRARCRMGDGMSLFRRCAVAFVSLALTLVPGRAGAAGAVDDSGKSVARDFGSKPPIPDAPEPTAGFDALRKPPIPVSFLAHDAGWIEFQYPPSARDRVAPLIAQSDDLRAELAEDLGQTPLDGIEVRVARGLEEMSTLAPQGSPPPPQAISASFAKLKLIVLSLGSVGATEPAELRSGFRRELARLALAEAVGGRTIPSWFAEGFVLHFSRDGEWTREWLLYRASVRHRLHATSELDAALDEGGAEGALAAAEAADFASFLLKPEKRARFSVAVERLRQGDMLESALASAYGSGLPLLERRWNDERTRLTTFMAVSAAIAVPALCLLSWGIVRALRRHRRRRGLVQPASKKAQRAAAASERARVHIVLSRREEQRLDPPIIAESEIPKVEHEGEWHTLH